MNKRLTGFSVFAVALLLLAMFPMFNQPTAVAQSEEGGTGACVFMGICSTSFSDSCAGQLGLWYGEGSFCVGPIPCDSFGLCPPRSAACCLGDGGCVALVRDLCVEAGGTPSPPFTPCSQVTCPQPCSADIDGDGMVGIVDFLDLLAAWGPCP